MELKRDYEIKNGFRYKWVLIMRYDLVIFNKINFNAKHQDIIYSDYDPNWNWFRGIIFLGSLKNMDEFGNIAEEIRTWRVKYNVSNIHVVENDKFRSILNYDESKYRHYIFKRFVDIEIYGQVLQHTTCLPSRLLGVHY